MRLRHRRQKGSAMVESALTLSSLLLIVFGIMDFGHALYVYNFVSYAARDATRYALARGQASGYAVSATDIQNRVKSLAAGMDSNALTTTVVWTPDNKPGSTVQVKVSYLYQPLSSFAIKSALTLQSTSQMVISQ